MSIASVAVEKKTVTYFATFLLIVAGLASFFSLGQLEDPEFTIKNAVVTTIYPGASPEEVELEVTDRIELAMQELPQLDYIVSTSRAGMSLIYVYILEKFGPEEMEQIWDLVRKKVNDLEGDLPPGCQTPIVTDDFGDVYGFVLALTGDGFSYRELDRYAKDIRKELSLVEGVSRVEFWGRQQETVYLDLTQQQISQLRIPSEVLDYTLKTQNAVADAGAIDVQSERLRVAPTGYFETPEDIADLTFRGNSLLASLVGDTQSNDQLIRLGDIATVRRGYLEPPATLMRYDGNPSIALSLTNVPGANVVTVGRNIDQRLEELRAMLPVGIEFHKIAWQGDVVNESINAFMINLAQAVVIVLIVIWASMGLRMALIIGVGGLLFVIIGTFMVMQLGEVDLQRMSLGALIIAMGMMVDNAIVVADGIAVRMKQGVERTRAAIEAATQPCWPLFGATIVAVMAFYPIFAAPSNTGEYCATLFFVVAAALMLSWLLSVTIIPLMCISLLPDPEKSKEGEDEYGGAFFKRFRSFLELAIRRRVPVLMIVFGLLAVAAYGFQFVDRAFFVQAARPQVMFDYWAPAGTKIQVVSERVKLIEKELLKRPEVTSVSTFVGQGPPRFYLPVEPERPYPSYSHFVVNTTSAGVVDTLLPEMELWMKEQLPEAITYGRKFDVGPATTWKVEARFSGPSEADPAVLRRLGEEGAKIVAGHPGVKTYRLDWRERVKKLVPNYDQKRGRWTGVSRANLAAATKRFHDGIPLGLFREGDEQIPIVARQVERERTNVEALGVSPVKPSLSRESVPLTQVVRGIDVEWEDPFIWRYNRRRAVTLQVIPAAGWEAATIRSQILKDMEAIERPPGYDLDWKGDHFTSARSQESLIPGMIPAVLIIALSVVALFNALRPPLIILCTIPFAMIGITAGLLTFGQSFGFMALLGTMSLAGMMIKNAIVLLDQIQLERAEGKEAYHAVVDSTLSRLRPVLNAAATTVLGVVPLLQDVFWVAMAVTIMAGLAFGTVLTLVLLPVLYALFYRIPSPPKEK